MVGWTLFSQLKALIAQKTDFPQARRNSANSQPLNCNISFPCVSSLQAHPADFALANLHHHLSQFLKTPVSTYQERENVAVQLSYILAAALLLLFFWGTLTNVPPMLNITFSVRLFLIPLFFQPALSFSMAQVNL